MNNKNIDFCYSNYFVLNDLGSNSVKKKAFIKTYQVVEFIKNY